MGLKLIKGLLLGALFMAAVAAAEQMPPQAAIATAHPLATEAGLDILRNGGNAFDAAVAVSATLAVVEPYSSGLGGGGFWLLHRAKDGFETMIDGRERAPLAAHPDMYLDEQGEVVPGLSINGALAAGIPGTPAALVHIAKRYGVLPLRVSLAPAIQHAKHGFEVDSVYRQMARFRKSALQASAASAEILLKDGEVPDEGDRVTQIDLAQTLERIAKNGWAGFYQGEVAANLVAAVRAAGGIWSERDLSDYRVIERQPVTGHYHGVRVTSAALPSSGGIVLLSMLNQLEAYDLTRMDDAQVAHLIIEAMRRAYRDRAAYLGDSDFIEVPTDLLTSKNYAAGLRQSIRLDRATASRELAPTHVSPALGNDTTHFSIIDAAGNRVSATLSINYPFGSGFIAAGTGVLLNDEMDDFAAKPGVANVYGLVGNIANAIAPGKRMLSSMSPTFLEDGERVAVLGGPGGSRIITMVLLGTLGFERHASASDIVGVGRFHHQYLPDVIQFEPGTLSKPMQQKLRALGHQLKPLDDRYGNMQVIIWDKKNNKIEAASDPRGLGSAVPGL